MLVVEQLRAGYNDAEVLFDVGLEVQEGEIVALIGANGAGKTTLLSAIAGLIPAMSGQIRFEGRGVTHLRAYERVDRGIVLVPEGRHLFSGMTVEENLRLGAHRRRDPRGVDRDLAAVFAMFPVLAERRRQLVGRMSGGEQQMCAVGRGVLSAPRLLMIDELSLGLAPIAVKALTAGLRQIRETGLTVLIVEQDVNTALGLAERGYVLETGRIVLAGRSAELAADPAIRTAYLGL
jgi:branched-chain amino acid transport system ATP-binding protein